MLTKHGARARKLRCNDGRPGQPRSLSARALQERAGCGDLGSRLVKRFGVRCGEIFRRRFFVKGIQFLVDDTGEKKAVLIDLKKYGNLWEDLYDAIVARERQDEPRESLEVVKQRLRRKGKLNRNG